MEQIRDCFVTGKWEAGKDAAALLDDDDDGKVLLILLFKDCAYSLLQHLHGVIFSVGLELE